jgi:CC1-like splicing factor
MLISLSIGYVEFYEPKSIPSALTLSGTQWMGNTITVQPTQAEKNRIAANQNTAAGPTRLYVGSLHFNITEEDLKSVFVPFGDIEFIDLHKDPETGRSKGFAFVQFKKAEEAKKAMAQINGLTLAGRQLKVGFVNEKGQQGQQSTGMVPGVGAGAHGELDDEGLASVFSSLSRLFISSFPFHLHIPLSFSSEGGVILKAADRAILMAKLQRGGDMIPGIQLPIIPNIPVIQTFTPFPGTLPSGAPIIIVPPSPCVLLKNMFDPTT